MQRHDNGARIFGAFPRSRLDLRARPLAWPAAGLRTLRIGMRDHRPTVVRKANFGVAQSTAWLLEDG
ncbi:hypothetical protein [Mycobacterium palustre]|uniref:Uncharacterized protein n=1 Tax=Mycobacterium palustre TaxID=153971 RepID=A0A1X1ZR84_9MYCO|nr:hypothetical protein [Mycobacterium palustre]MCV7099057.1 hypothetical protein [Mycobacterium palustre]ORW25758.1 hypothetical protein AWC19_06160 [Mycobacterium palustre]